jgi:hypothetical protein
MSIIKEKLKNVRIRKLKDGQYKGQTKINKWTNIDLQNTAQKTNH